MLTNDYVPGAPSWLDLGSRDVEGAAAFYRALFGWEFRSAGPDAGGYGMFQLDGQTVAGLGPITEEGGSPAWTLYFETADADATTKDVEQAGGSVRFAPLDIGDQGRIAGYTDPSGAQFAVYQPGTLKGLDRTGVGALCWTELYTTDAEQAKRFYGTVFGWDTADMPLAADAGVYTVVSRAGGGQAGSHGGIMQLTREQLPDGVCYWQPYVGVADADGVVTTAASHGATVLMPTTQVGGIGRVALLRDPEGAFFAVLQPDPQMA
ncbi:VOC family protein [Streptomyces sp. NBC_00448]|uniref:VOC family protein n=1 Tax=Streptomyces sp. NBC_00448 TaxID=2903652 RepID=UPI002E227C08